MIKLSRLLNGITKINNPNILETKINSITTDSRKITRGDLFVAYKGVSVDGHNYINGGSGYAVPVVIG